MKKRKKVIVTDYNPIWPEQFEAIKKTLLQHLKTPILAIEHVGSTSVPGLKAKPIIDLDIIVKKDDTILQRVIEELRELGYIHVGDLGVTGREAFKKIDVTTPNDGSGRIWFDHHLYLCPEGSIGLRNHLNLRDYLRQHPEKVEEYGNLKQELAHKFPYDIDAYIDGKTAFIVEVLDKMGMTEEDMETITIENKFDMQLGQYLQKIQMHLIQTHAKVLDWFEQPATLKNYRPEDGGWTIAEILEHIALTSHFLLILIAKGTNKALRNTKKRSLEELKTNFDYDLGKLDEIGRHKSFVWMRPEHMIPQGKKSEWEIKNELINQLYQCLNLLNQLRNGEGLLHEITMTVNDLGKINMYEYIYFLSKHAERHLQQMEENKREFTNQKSI